MTFDSSTPFILIARIKVKTDKVEEYLELANATDFAVEVTEPNMLHHTFDQDPEDHLCFTWSEAYKDDAAFLTHLSKPPVKKYLVEHSKLGDGFSVEVYGTVGSESRAAMEATGFPLKISESKCGFSRV